MKKRICALLLAVVMVVGLLPAFTLPASAAENVVFDWDCSSISAVGSVSSNSKSYFIADGSSWTNRYTYGTTSGQVKVGGSASSKGYATLTINNDSMTQDAFKLEMSMNVESLVTASESPMWTGFVIDFTLPSGKNIYISLREFDGVAAGDTTATIGVSKSSRGGDGHTVEFDVPTDGAFHTWSFQYDGISMLRFAIDGQIVRDFADVSYTYADGTPGTILFKNLHLRMADGSATNLIHIDSMKLTEGTTLRYNEYESVSVPEDAVADDFKVAVSTKYVADTNPMLTVKVQPRGDASQAVTVPVTQTSTEQTVSVGALPFSGICTVTVDCTEAQTYEFDYYIYNSKTVLSAGASASPTEENQLYTFSDFTAVELPADSAWYKAQYVAADGTGTVPTADDPSAMFIPATATVHSFTVPATLTGNFAVYVGYVEGTQYVTVNGESVLVNRSAASSNTVKEAFATTVSMSGGQLVISNTANALAKIAYVKLVSLTDEMYALSKAVDTSHNLITDNDGYSTLTSTSKGDIETLFQADFVNKNTLIDQRQFIWCTFSTSILNYNSQAWWDHVNAWFTEKGIENKLEHHLDHILVTGEGDDLTVTYPDYTYKMRDADQNAFNNILALNPKEADGKTTLPENYLHAQLADRVKANDLGEIYVSLRMSHFSSVGAQYEFQSGSYYRQHQDWRRVGAYNEDGTVKTYNTQLSYYYEGYRQYLHDILMEMAAPENVTGILLDFGRYYLIFGEECADVTERTTIMNGFIEELRTDLNTIGKKLTVRVLDPIDEKATAWGLDYQTWVKNGWVDRVYISCQSHETFFDFGEYIDFFANYPEVEFYLGVNATLSGHDTTKAEEDFMQAGGTIQKGERVDENTIMLRVYDFYNAGADGVLMFNWSSSNTMFKNMNNATLMKQWYNFSYPAALVPETPMRFRESDSTVFVESVTLSADTLAMEASQTAVVTATVLPADATNQKVVWSSSDTAIATVKNGTVTAVDAGTAVIYATSVDGEITDSVTVTVTVTPVEGVVVDQSAVTVGVGSAVTVTAAVTPADASRQGIVWTTSNDQIATVDDGVITGLSEGTATITATSVEGGLNGDLKADVTVTVVYINPESVTLDKDAVTLNIGQTDTLTATVLPENASNKEIIWTSSDDTVATVKDGVVTALTAGTATVTAESADNSTLKAEATVTVNRMDVTGVTLPQDEYRLNVGEKLQISAAVSPENATDPAITWTSSDDTVAAVEEGVLPVLTGTTASMDVIPVSYDGSGYSGGTEYGSTPKVTSLSDILTIWDAHKALLASYTEENQARWDKFIVPSFEGVACDYDGEAQVLTVNITLAYGSRIGLLAAAKADGTPLTIAENNMGYSDDTHTSTSIWDGGTGRVETLTLTFTDVETPEDLVIYAASKGSSLRRTVKIDIHPTLEFVPAPSKGLITALTNGVAEITVTTKEGGYTDTAVVKVGSAVTGVELDKEEITLVPGRTATLTAAVLPADAADKTVLWTSTDDTVATVKDGVVTALKTGTATVTATTKEGGYTDTVTVTVGVSVSGITLDTDALTLKAGETDTVTAVIVPEDAADKSITWTSTDDTVAAVTPLYVYEGKAKAVTADAVADYLTTLPVSDTDWETAKAATDYTNANYAKLLYAPGVTYVYDEAAKKLTLTVSLENGTENPYGWSSNLLGYAGDYSDPATQIPGLVVTKADGVTVVPYAAHNLAKDDPSTGIKPFGSSYVKEMILTFENVEALEDLIVWMCGAGSSTERTAKISISLDGGEKTVTDASAVKITALKAGEATVTATTADGGYTDTVLVTVAAAGYTLTGTAAAWNDTDNALYYLYPATVADADIRAEWTAGTYLTAGNVLATGTAGEITAADVDGKAMYTQTFSFAGVTDGTYKLVVMKAGKYVPKITEITVSGAALDAGTLKLWRYGDVNYDGFVNELDALQIVRYGLGKASVFQSGDDVTMAERLIAADVYGDGYANEQDALQIVREALGKASLVRSLP